MTTLFNNDVLDDLYEDGIEGGLDENLEIPDNDPLSVLVGDGKKYKTPADLVKAVVAKDQFITRLKGENAELRVDLKTKDRVEQTVDQLLRANNVNPVVAQVPQNTQGSPGDNVDNPQNLANKSLTAEQVKELIEADRKQTKAQNNIEAARKQLVDLYGSQSAALEAVKKTGIAIGESQEFFDALAARNPNVLISLVSKTQEPKVKKSDNQLSLFNDGVITQSTSGGDKLSVNGVRTKAFYDNLKKQNISQYWSAQTQAQMHKDAIALGPNFFNN